MSVGSFFKKLLASAPAKSVEAFALTETQKAVAALSQTSIGKTVAADVATMTDSMLTGSQKFEHVVANTLPLIVQLLSSSGRNTALTDVEDIGRALVQTIYNDAQSTKAGSVASLILGLLGVK